MKNKTKRFAEIKEIIQNSDVRNQEELLNLLIERGYKVTQATLSRDLKQLKVARVTNMAGKYVYRLSQPIKNATIEKSISFVTPNMQVAVNFSGNIAVLHTKAGYASGLAYDIDEKAKDVIIGTVAGEDTIIAIIKDNVNRNDVIKSLKEFIPTLEY